MTSRSPDRSTWPGPPGTIESIKPLRRLIEAHHGMDGDAGVRLYRSRRLPNQTCRHRAVKNGLWPDQVKRNERPGKANIPTVSRRAGSTSGQMATNGHPCLSIAVMLASRNAPATDLRRWKQTRLGSPLQRVARSLELEPDGQSHGPRHVLHPRDAVPFDLRVDERSGLRRAGGGARQSGWRVDDDELDKLRSNRRRNLDLPGSTKSHKSVSQRFVDACRSSRRTGGAARRPDFHQKGSVAACRVPYADIKVDSRVAMIVAHAPARSVVGSPIR